LARRLSSPRKRIPPPLPGGLLADLAISGLGLFLDYDGTLAEIVTDPAKAVPLPGVPEILEEIARSPLPIAIAIVTGRRIHEVKRMLGIGSGILFSGVHGMEFEDSEGRAGFVPAVLKYSKELASVREWLQGHVPAHRGFRIEDKEAAIGLHYREADPAEAQRLIVTFSEFVARSTPHLKLMRLKMLAEAMPRSAGNKGRTVADLKRRFPPSWAAAYFGDDTTDEDAFAALDANDVSVLVGPERATLARYRVSGPLAVRDELNGLAAVAKVSKGRERAPGQA
jgi:trehalose-phosphatase